MAKKYWFKAKTIWVPITWQGWLIFLLYLTALILAFRMIDGNSHSGSDTLINFVPIFLSASALFLAICYIKGDRSGWIYHRYTPKGPLRGG